MFDEKNIIILDKKINTKEELFAILAKKGVELEISDSESDLLNGFKEREAIGTTGFQDSFGIPHCKKASIKKPGIVFVKATIPIEWDSLDGKPLENMFALYIPEVGADVHLQMLTNISRKLMHKDFREKIKNSSNPAELLGYVKEVI